QPGDAPVEAFDVGQRFQIQITKTGQLLRLHLRFLGVVNDLRQCSARRHAFGFLMYGYHPLDNRGRLGGQRWRSSTIGSMNAQHRHHQDRMVGSDGASALRQQRSEEYTSELQSRENLVCRLLLEKKK